MKKILFYARDPGSVNVTIPIINKLKCQSDFNLIVFAKEYAVARFEREGIGTEILLINSVEDAISVLNKENPDIVITGSSLDDYTERYLWKASEYLKIPSYAIMDQWILLGIRFSKYDYRGIEEYRSTLTHDYFPRRILVMDDVAKKRLIEDNVPEGNIIVTGQPHFDEVRRNYGLAEKKKKLSDVKTIVFASEPKIKDGEVTHLGYSERSIFENILETVVFLSNKYNFKYSIIIRPHPRENADSWSDILYNKDVFVDKETDSFTLMKNADLVCGMSSMFLVEAAICRVPIVSCLIGLKSESPFVFDQIGVYRSCRNREELSDQIKKTLIDGKPADLKVDFIENATDKTVKYIMEDMKNVHSGN